MFSRVLLIILLIISVSASPAQIMHIHMGEEERVFNLVDIDSITYTEFEINLSVEPDEIDFGEIRIGHVQNALLTINNIGNGELIISSIDLEEGIFSIFFEDSIFIAPNQSFEFTVNFTPDDVGNFATELVIHSNSQQIPEVRVQVFGFGIRNNFWEYEQTDINMSILVTSATVNGELLVEGDFIGVFTPDGTCAGYSQVPEDFPEEQVGIPAWGADEGMDNGFHIGDELDFRFWDVEDEREIYADVEVQQGGEPVFSANGFLVVSLTERE
jgi:hypothetical protein